LGKVGEYIVDDFLHPLHSHSFWFSSICENVRVVLYAGYVKDQPAGTIPTRLPEFILLAKELNLVVGIPLLQIAL
jgi:hypothetical protein